MSFAFEKDFEDALIEKLTKLENQWSRNILNYCSEEDLIKNWADIIFKNNNTTDKLNGYPLTETEMKQIIGDIDGDSPFSINRKLNGKYVSIIRDNPRDTAHLGERVDLFIFDKDDILADVHHGVHIMSVDDRCHVVFHGDVVYQVVYQQGGLGVESGVGLVAE